MEQTPSVEHAEQAKAQLQRIIEEFGPSWAHRSPVQVRTELVSAIAAAGLAEPPRPWLDSAVAELTAGRGLVMDARFEADIPGPGPSDPETQE